MDRLSIILTLVTGAVLTGGLVTIAFSLGFYSWLVIAGCVIVGFAFSWPSGYVASRLIKKNDPAWSHGKVHRIKGIIPRKNAREV